VEPHRDDPVSATNTVTGTHQAAPVHAARPRQRNARLVAAGCGVLAVLAAAAVGLSALLHSPTTTSSTVTSANMITVGPRVPLSDKQLIALVGRKPDFGSLVDQKRRSACLAALGYPGNTQVLGAESVRLDGHTAVVLVLPGQQPNELAVFAVAPSCSSADTGVIANTTVRRP